MPKIILEKADVEKLIKDKYPGAEIVSGMDKFEDVIIRVESYIQTKSSSIQSQPQVQVVQPTKPPVDETLPNALALETRPETIPGRAMGRERSQLPIF